MQLTDLPSFHNGCFLFDHALPLHRLFVRFVQIGERLLQIADLLLGTVQFVGGSFGVRLQPLEFHRSCRARWHRIRFAYRDQVRLRLDNTIDAHAVEHVLRVLEQSGTGLRFLLHQLDEMLVFLLGIGYNVVHFFEKRVFEHLENRA